MKTVNFFSLLAMVGLLLASCGSSMKVTTDFDRSVDFSQYKTFGVYKLPENTQTINQLTRDRIYSSIKKALIAKGLTESDNPDIYVNSITVVELREAHSSTTTGMGGMGMGMGMMGMGMGGMHRPYMWGGGPMMMMGGPMISHTQHHVEEYQRKSFMIDIIDAKTHNLVWNGVGNRRIDKKFTRNADEKILKYVKQLLSGFPPAPIVHSTTKVREVFD